MKRLILMVLVMTVGSQLSAQTDAISKYFDKYVDDTERFNYASFSGKMFQMISKIELDDPDEQKFLEESIGKVKGVKLLGAERDVDGRKLYKEALGVIDGKGFEELMSMREDDKDIRFMIKEKDNKIDEFFMVLGGDDEFALLSVFGDGIDLNMLYKLSKVVGIDTFNELEKLENRGGR